MVADKSNKKKALAKALAAKAKKNPMDESKKHEAMKGDMKQDKKEEKGC
jgi:hypothetical protein